MGGGYMKIPKKIDRLLQRRTRLAEDWMAVIDEIDTWIEKNGGNLSDSDVNDGVLSGAMIYFESANAEEIVRRYIEKI